MDRSSIVWAYLDAMECHKVSGRMFYLNLVKWFWTSRLFKEHVPLNPAPKDIQIQCTLVKIMDKLGGKAVCILFHFESLYKVFEYIR